ncbi:hypothetical protein AOQ84DRAFT_317043 [Glonium stellatum]|uniref:tRNA-splicing endonuclease subunit Sen15 domain-containing protein n=1 Tax=Glonium stellatum TaxID=574774 RepID=A0A8E2F329_9PEZI|nr:hypothetical protein AOQ84DRAFT_317043 [Glonium stellatum]
MAMESPSKALVPAPSALTNLLKSQTPPSSHPAHLHHLALQIQHNLQHQHGWTALRIHTHSPVNHTPLQRPLLSGLPPHRLYTHPDEQAELLKELERRRKAARKSGISADSENVVVPEPEREWVLPTKLNEKWSLGRMAEVFDGVEIAPPSGENNVRDVSEEESGKQGNENKWKQTKRIVLATVDEDSTVVYYIVHDGVVKPRQN